MTKPLKYVYQIRSRNGVVVNNLQIYGRTEEEAREKLMQMYHHCEILACNMVAEHYASSNYEEVLDVITKDD